jgi:hypothetical protein
MAYFDLDKYMTAEERIELWAKENPDFRMSSDWGVSEDSNFVFVTVKLYKTWADQVPFTTGLAGESLATQFAIEKCETSAYARAISNSGDPKYSTMKDGTKAPRANRAEMEAVKPVYSSAGSKSRAVEMALRTDIKNNPWTAPEAKAEPAQWQVEDVAAALGGEVLDVTYECAHGKMIRREGTSAKTNKPYYGFVCTEKSKADQCEPKWGRLTANGKWSFGEQDK